MVDEGDEDEAPALVDLTAATTSVATNTATPPLAEPSNAAKSLAPSLPPPAAASPADATTPPLPLPPTPLTILTGFLGAGKTTLVSALLRHFGSLGQRVAIVNNEASASSVEPSLVESSSVMSFGTLLTLANGCVCCSLTSDLISALNYLLRPAQAERGGEMVGVAAAAFAYVVVECSGLASPGPLLEQLWVDDALEQRVYLDGVLCVVDCKHFRANLAGSEGAQMEQQLVFSDAVLVNKCDTVDAAERERVVAEVRRINSQCDVYPTERSHIAVDRILHIRAFERNLPRTAQHHTHCRECDSSSSPHAAHSHSHPSLPAPVPHIHDTSLVNLVFSSPRPVSLPALKAWLSELLWTDVYEGETGDASVPAPTGQHGREAAAAADGSQRVYRMKAAMRTSDGSVWFLQSVQRLFDLFEAQSEDDKRSVQGVRLVVIGRNLQQAELDAGFQRILAADELDAT